MRLKATQPEATHVSAILLDGKAIPMAHEADEEEGWVKSYIPHLPKIIKDGKISEEKEQSIMETVDGMKLVKREGTVEIKWKPGHDPRKE